MESWKRGIKGLGAVDRLNKGLALEGYSHGKRLEGGAEIGKLVLNRDIS